ncbi:MAG: Maf family protein [Micrococcaceae bacterium]
MYSTKLILASGSPARLKTLRTAGFDPIVQISTVNERKIEDQLQTITPAKLALELAKAKTLDVAHKTDLNNYVVIGCDSVFEHQGKVWGKPHTAENAILRIKAQQGTSGVLHTGHWLCYKGNSIGVTNSTIVTFTSMTESQIQKYVASKEPLEVAGSFTIDGLGAAFIKEIQGDPHNVVGISVNTLTKLFTQVGLDITDFWKVDEYS